LGAAGKASFAVAVALLFAAGRADRFTLASGGVDLLLGAIFLVAYWRTGVSPGEEKG
jgi:hypothetical protein